MHLNVLFATLSLSIFLPDNDSVVRVRHHVASQYSTSQQAVYLLLLRLLLLPSLPLRAFLFGPLSLPLHTHQYVSLVALAPTSAQCSFLHLLLLPTGPERPGGRAMCFQSGLDGKSKQSFCVYQATAPSPRSLSRL